MVPLTSVPSEFAGRVLVAKLGSAGILAELRGVSRVYPTLFGEPQVWVEAGELADARVLITTDTDDVLEVDPADASAGPGWPPQEGWTRGGPAIDDGAPRRRPVRPLLVGVAAVLLVSLAFAPRACSPARPVSRPAARP
jgi:hypothetical protein